MSDLKFKLSKTEYVAVFHTMSKLKTDTLYDSLEGRAIREILHKLYMRIAQKMFSLKAQNSFNLTWSEAWAFFKEMPKIMPTEGYEFIVVQEIINIIHQKTI